MAPVATTLMPLGTMIDLSVIPVPIVPPPDPGPTPVQVWREKAQRLVRLKALGLTSLTAVRDIQALDDEVNATYVSGYASQF
jgi:hypothetical protein